MGKGSHHETAPDDSYAMAATERKSPHQAQEDLTEEEHDKLLRKIEKLLCTDPENFLPDNLNLLEEDFDALGRARAFDQ